MEIHEAGQRTMGRLSIPDDANPEMKLAIEQLNLAIEDLEYDGYTMATHELKVQKASARVRLAMALMELDDRIGEV